MQNKTPSQLEMDGVPSFYIGIHGVSTHRMGHLDIPVWCKDADSVLIAMNFINNYQQPKTEPKRWTAEDQKAGRLPEVGCIVFDKINETEVTIKVINKRQACLESNDGFIYLLPPSEIKPIESPEEKAARLREEWCIKALSSCSILSGMQKYELKRLGEYIEDIYDALLSGELPMPSKKGGE